MKKLQTPWDSDEMLMVDIGCFERGCAMVASEWAAGERPECRATVDAEAYERLRAAGQQALEAMDNLHRTGDTQVFDMYGCEATEALRAALEPVTDCHDKEGDKLPPPFDHIPDVTKMMASVREDRTVEPVAYIHETGFLVRNPAATLTAGMKLYSAPPKREPMTDAEMEPLRRRMMMEAYNAADDGDLERYNALKVMCNDVLDMLSGVRND